MKKVLFVFVLGVFAACGGNTGAEASSDSASVTLDTASNAINSPGGTGAATMTVDSTGMSEGH